MSLESDRDVLKNELEKTTASAGLFSEPKKEGEEDSKNLKKVSVGIRTYAADIADIMRREKGSVIKIALAEQQRRRLDKEKRDPTSTKNLIVILLGVIFIVSGILVFVYTILNRDTPVIISPTPLAPSLIYSENQTQIDVTRETRGNFYKQIHGNLNASYADNKSITNLYIVSDTAVGKSPISSQIFFNKLGIKVPDNVVALLSGQMMLGVHKIEDQGNLFLIIRTKEFNQTFSAMKDWEISMANDLVRLFRIDPKSFSGDIFSLDFKTTVLFNKESRSLYDKEGNLVLTYVYLDKNTIIITTNQPLVEEVIKRINSQSIK